MAGLLPWIIVALVAFVLLRMVLGAIKTSAKLMMWAVIAIVALGAGFLWYQGQLDGTQQGLPSLSIPGNSDAPYRYSNP